MTPVPRPFRLVALLAALALLLLQCWAPRQAVAMLVAEAAAAVAEQSLCQHDEAPDYNGPARPDAGHGHRLCPDCLTCCAVPAAIPPDGGVLPLPHRHGLVQRRRIGSPPRRRSSIHRPNARSPPGSSHRRYSR